MGQVRINRSFLSCTTVVLVFSIVCFWIPRLYVFDAPNAVAGYMGGRIGATAFKGVAAGFVGGTIAAVVYLVGFLLVGWLDGPTLLRIVLMPFHTAFFGVVGGLRASRL